MSVRTDSVAEFICSARAIAQQGVFTMATLDFDHLTHFVKRYGPLVVSHAVQESRAQIAEALDRLVKGSYALLFSSGDEIVLVHSCSDQESICRALDEARQAVISVSRRFFPDPEDRPFCFTAVICSSELLCEDLSADAKLRTLSVASEHAMDDLKRSGQRGVTSSLKTVAERNEAEYARRVALAESIWHTASPVAVDARRLAPHVLSIPCFWSAVRSHKGDSTLALIRPLYEGSLWQSAKEWLDGGVEVLPDGKTAGKQGFLNRLVGHLTTSLLSEIVGLRGNAGDPEIAPRRVQCARSEVHAAVLKSLSVVAACRARGRASGLAGRLPRSGAHRARLDVWPRTAPLCIPDRHSVGGPPFDGMCRCAGPPRVPSQPRVPRAKLRPYLLLVYRQ